MISKIIIKKKLFILILISFTSFSQDWNDRAGSGVGLNGFSLGLILQGQTKYPEPYLGPKVNGLYNDGAYHFILDIYYNRFLIGFQLSDEFLYLEKFDSDGSVWKPRGYNNSYSSLTRTYWFTIGYNVINNFNIKFGAGLRIGPKRQLTNKNYTPTEIAYGYNYLNPESIFNTSNPQAKFSEIDYCLSINYPIKVYGKFGIVPEIGYTIKHGGLLTGLSIIY